MLRLIGIVMVIGLADSMNPSTVAPGLFMASEPDGKRTVAEFMAGVFVVYFSGGLLIALGPGAIILSLVPKPSHQTTQLLEVVAGVVLITVGLLLWRYREPLGNRRLPKVNSKGRRGWVLGASIMAFELPTAFPYFAALAAVISSGVGVFKQLILVAIFNACFVTPLASIWLVLHLGGGRAERYLQTSRRFLERHWPLVLASIALVAGSTTIALGATGTVRIMRRTLRHTFRRSLNPVLDGTAHGILHRFLRTLKNIAPS
ncbi:MAG: GAP family protein [Solirubrobacteraceae bacterium]